MTPNGVGTGTVTNHQPLTNQVLHQAGDTLSVQSEYSSATHTTGSGCQATADPYLPSFCAASEDLRQKHNSTSSPQSTARRISIAGKNLSLNSSSQQWEELRHGAPRRASATLRINLDQVTFTSESPTREKYYPMPTTATVRAVFFSACGKL